MKLVIFMPAFNEAETIAQTIKRIPTKLKNIDKIELLVVDDGSADDTADIAKKAGANVISHVTNKGLGKAFQTGLNWALDHKADILTNIDADGQFNPNDIQKLIDPILSDKADMVASNRFNQGRPTNMSKTKYWGNKQMTNLINKLSGGKFQDVSSGFRAYNREAMLHLNLLGQFTYTQEVFLDLSVKGLRIIQIPVDVKYFKQRKSRVAGNIINYALKTSMIIFRTIRDYKPLKFFGLMGASIFLLGMFCDIFLLVHYIRTSAFSPYISIGFIGAYLNTMGLGIIFLGLIADMFDRVRMTQEKILYYEKLSKYGK